MTGLPPNNSYGDDGHYLDGDQARPAVYPSTVLLAAGAAALLGRRRRS